MKRTRETSTGKVLALVQGEAVNPVRARTNEQVETFEEFGKALGTERYAAVLLVGMLPDGRIEPFMSGDDVGDLALIVRRLGHHLDEELLDLGHDEA